MSREMICVYRAASVPEADLVAGWLRDEGITAYVKDAYAATMLPVSAIVAPRGVEVCVMEASQVERASQVLQDYQAKSKGRELHHPGATVNAVCPECRTWTEFPFNQRGSTQYCPHCKASINVPFRERPDHPAEPGRGDPPDDQANPG